MPIIPSKTQDFLDWAQAHADTWQAAGASIGLTAGQAAAFVASASTARTAFNNQQAAQDAAKVATAQQQEAVSDARREAGDLIRIIKSYAEVQSNPDTVYNTAQIPAPQPPGEMPPPGVPFNFKVGLNSDGSITLRWKCDNPDGSQGTVYNVRRKLPTQTAFEFVGAVGTRAFSDVTIPAGTANIQYIVQAQRGTSVGAPSQTQTIYFGQSGSGNFIAGVISGDGVGARSAGVMVIKAA